MGKRRNPPPPWLASAALVMILLCVALGVASAYYGSLPAAMAAARGEIMYVSPSRIELGRVQPLEAIETRLVVQNLTFQPLRIAGARSTCTCQTIGGLPVVLRPGQTQELLVRTMIPSGGPDTYSQSIELYANTAGPRPVIEFHAEINRGT